MDLSEHDNLGHGDGHVMDEQPGADNGGEQIKEGQKTGDGLTGQMWCTEYSSELFENSFYEPIKLS